MIYLIGEIIMNIKKIGKIKGDQDGAIFNNYLFRFDSVGTCYVYDISKFDISVKNTGEINETASFSLDRTEELRPHSNSVMFGCKYYSKDDEFPLLYTNIYNNYSWTDNKMKGVTLVYRIERNENNFKSTLVQIIEIGFTENVNYWKSSDEKDDVRPYGNFAIDNEKGIYYAFTMRDKTNTTRYFAFDLPEVTDGKMDEKYGVNRVVLGVKDIKIQFDCSYQHYIQGACAYKSKIYTLEGFTDNEENPSAMRIVDLTEKKEISFIDLYNMGYTIEPEMIDFWDNVCYYADNHGNFYIIDF